MSNAPQWITTTIKREKIHAQEIALQDRNGNEFKGHLEVEKINEQGQMIVRACYNPSSYSGTVMLTAFRLSQEQMDTFSRDGKACILKLA
jgi:hypothetical protein